MTLQAATFRYLPQQKLPAQLLPEGMVVEMVLQAAVGSRKSRGLTQSDDTSVLSSKQKKTAPANMLLKNDAGGPLASDGH